MIASPLMLDLVGPKLTAKEKELLQHPLVGGVILFSRNYIDALQLKALVKSIKKIKPLLVAVDQEGGRVQRFVNGFTKLAALGELGQLYLQSPEQACELTQQHACTMATELAACAIDICFAPVLDVDQGLSSVIGDRSFSNNANVVSTLGEIYINTMGQQIHAVAKHFPGHGAVAADSHVATVVDSRAETEITAVDLLPFQAAIKANVYGIMSSHVSYQQVDSNPASFSSYWLRQVLRQQLGFQGMIFSDDLNMQAANIGGFTKRVKTALHAGCDMVLICNNEQAVVEVLGDSLWT